MALEIERKFLLSSSVWRENADGGCLMEQGYFDVSGATVRVRVTPQGGFLTIKGAPRNFSRSEFEYGIPRSDAEAMLREFCTGRTLRKIRYRVPAGSGLTWEIDEYFDANAGLFTAEIELPAEDTPFARPLWLGTEVTGDRRYTNKALVQHPFTAWGE